MQYEEDLPLEEYIYTEALKERHHDIERFKQLISIENNQNEEDSIELLYVSKRLFYNFHGEEKVIQARQQMMHFLDIEINDERIPMSMSGSNGTEHDEKIETLLNAMDDLEDLKKLKLKKLAQDYPEVPFFTHMKIVMMYVKEMAPKRIIAQIEDALSITPEDTILQLERDSLLAREGKTCQYLNADTIEKGSLKKLFNNREWIHSFELMTAHTAIFEYLVSKEDLLSLDAFIFATNTLHPEWEESWADKELYSELLKVQFCKNFIH